jgi:diacylglycerol kinase family enzyme
MLGIPGDVVDATEHLLRMADDFRPRKVDLGIVNDRFFTFSAGLGLDASVVARVDSHPKLKSRLGAYYFTYAAFGTFTRKYVARPPRMEAVLPDGRTFSGVTALVQNSDPYTYFNGMPLRVAEGADLESGTFAGIVLRRSTPTVMPGIAYRLLTPRGRVAGHRAVDGFSDIDNLVVRSLDERPIALQVDGDFLGEVDEARFSIEPRGLAVVS